MRRLIARALLSRGSAALLALLPVLLPPAPAAALQDPAAGAGAAPYQRLNAARPDEPPVFLVKRDSRGDRYAIDQALLAAYRTGRDGATVALPVGRWTYDGELVFPYAPGIGPRVLVLKGTGGRGYTRALNHHAILAFRSIPKGGAGIRPPPGASTDHTFAIEGLVVQSEDGTGSGIRTQSRARLTDVSVSGFGKAAGHEYAGQVEVVRDHVLIERCELSNGRYALWFPAQEQRGLGAGYGNIRVKETLLAMCSRALVGFDPLGGRMEDGQFVDCHFFGAPLAFYQEDPPAAVANLVPGALMLVSTPGSVFEGIGSGLARVRKIEGLDVSYAAFALDPHQTAERWGWIDFKPGATVQAFWISGVKWPARLQPALLPDGRRVAVSAVVLYGAPSGNGAAGPGDVLYEAAAVLDGRGAGSLQVPAAADSSAGKVEVR